MDKFLAELTVFFMNAEHRPMLQIGRRRRKTQHMRILLDRLGISPKYKGYRMLLIAVEIAVQDEDAMTQIMNSPELKTLVSLHPKYKALFN